MKVETFEQTELIAGKQEEESDPEALALIESLGLEGQKKMTTVTENDITVRCPYRVMTAKEMRVYECLYPKKVELKEYSDAMIPLRVLQVAAHAKELSFFDKFFVWCENDKPKDPILVGTKKTTEYSTSTYILARWGESLESFPILFERAKKMTVEGFKSRTEKVKANCELILASLEAQAIDHLNGEFVHIPY